MSYSDGSLLESLLYISTFRINKDEKYDTLIYSFSVSRFFLFPNTDTSLCLVVEEGGKGRKPIAIKGTQAN